MFKVLVFFLATFLSGIGCNTAKEASKEKEAEVSATQIQEGHKVAYFASGCFWCVEAVYESVAGVSEVFSGYAEGSEENARYDLVSSGSTKHVEAVKVIYDPSVVTYQTLVIVFFGSGDPTTLNQQGPDKGYQYRSAIYYQNEKEKMLAEKLKNSFEEGKIYSNPIVTDITPFTTFFLAEEYHQDFERKNPNQPYVKAVSVPRLKKFQANYSALLKSEH